MADAVTYKTKQRDLIINCLKQSKNRHMTADEIYEKIKTAGENVGKTTIYRCLAKLTEFGDVRKYVVDNTACYQYVDDAIECQNHYHLKCSRCQKIFHIDAKELKGLEDVIREKYDFNIDHAKVVIYGQCKKCS